MISITPFNLSPASPSEPAAPREDYGEVEYLLGRADVETVAAIRAIDPRVAVSHAGMAKRYSEQSRELIARIDEAVEPRR